MVINAPNVAKFATMQSERKAEGILETECNRKVDAPTSWINPLVAVDKANGDICTHMPRYAVSQPSHSERKALRSNCPKDTARDLECQNMDKT